MGKITDILTKIDEALYHVYNTEEEQEEGLTPEERQTYDGENLRNMFIGSLDYASGDDIIKALRQAIDKMPDEWVADFLRVQNGDTVEVISESINEEKYEVPGIEYFRTHGTLIYPITYKVTAEDEIRITAYRDEDGSVSYGFEPKTVTTYDPKQGKFLGYKTIESCVDEALLNLKRYLKEQGIDKVKLQIGKPLD